MVRSRLGLKTLGLFAALFGLMAVMAGSAQAEATSFWTIVSSGGTLTKVAEGTLTGELQVKEIEELKAEGDVGKHVVLLTTIGATNTPISILCSVAELKNAAGTAAPTLLKEGSLLGKAKFSGCITKLKGVTSAPCKPHSKGAAEGTIETEVAKGLIKLHELTSTKTIDDTVLLAPDNENNRFVRIILGKEGIENECSAGEFLTVEGELVVYDPAGNTSFTEEKVEHLITEFPGLQLLKFGSRAATIDGSAIVRLVGTELGLKWSGIPG